MEAGTPVREILFLSTHISIDLHNAVTISFNLLPLLCL